MRYFLIRVRRLAGVRFHDAREDGVTTRGQRHLVQVRIQCRDTRQVHKLHARTLGFLDSCYRSLWALFSTPARVLVAPRAVRSLTQR
jgi:hypothetical protein